MQPLTTYILFSLLIIPLLGCVPTPLNLAAGVTEPRDSHYFFAHYSLPSLLFTETNATLENLEFNGQAFINAVWLGTNDDLSKKGRPLLSAEGLTIHKEYIKQTNLYLVEMPKPVGITESYYVVISVKDNVPRYFTLEVTVTAMCNGREQPTVFGEWTREHEHLNYGCGPLPDAKQMVERVVEQLQRTESKGPDIAPHHS